MHASGELQRAAAALLAARADVSVAALLAAGAVLLWALYRALRPAARPTYLVDFAVHKVRAGGRTAAGRRAGGRPARVWRGEGSLGHCWRRRASTVGGGARTGQI